MAPRRKRQKLEEDGEAVAAALAGVSEDFHQPQADDADPASKPTVKKNSRSLFVRALPDGATSESLAAFFSESYPLKHATLVTDRVTKKSKGFGFVTFADSEDALKAQEEFNGALFEGKKIKVELAEPRHRDNKGDDQAPETKTITKHKVHGKDQDGQGAPRLIVRNLPWSIKTSDQLTVLFRSYGTVKQATLPTPKKGLSAGFGFVLLRGRKNAEKAIAGLNGKQVDGRTITVDWALDKTTWESLQGVEKKKLLEDSIKDEEDKSGSPILIQDDKDDSDDDHGGVLVTPDDDAQSDEDDEDEDDDVDDDLDLTQRSDNENDEDEEDEDEEDEEPEDYSPTLFVRNLPFTATDEGLSEHFSQFGPVRYARVVMDHETNRSRGTAFVCFKNSEDATSCLRQASKPQSLTQSKEKSNIKRSILEDTQSDPFGHYTLDGRVLQLSRAVDRKEAHRLEVEGQSARDTRDRDKRRLYLLSEGTVSPKSSLYATLSQTEIKMREDSSKQRQALIKSNPSLHLSFTRLSIRNIPRHITSKDLKALAREAVVGFAIDVKEKKRQALTKEELSRGAEEMKRAEQERKAKGRGIVTQAKIVFEGREGGKVSETSGAGKSRGYGFIEYSSHRCALMGLRWLNGRLIKQNSTAKQTNSQTPADKARRLIVEFAIENAQVVARRQDRQQKESRFDPRDSSGKGDRMNRKRKAEHDTPVEPAVDTTKTEQPVTQMSITARNMIGKKRAIRKARRTG